MRKLILTTSNQTYSGYKIVTVSDHLLTTQAGFASEMCGAKIQLSPKRLWGTMFAGEDRVFNDVCLAGFRRMTGLQSESWTEVMKITKEELDTGVKVHESALTREQAGGQADIRLRHVKTALVVAGFERTTPHVCVIDDSPNPQCFGRRGFAVIGDGHWPVEQVIEKYWEFKRGESVESAIFKLCAAKFAGESHRAVGHKTCVTIHGEDGVWQVIHNDDLEIVRTACRDVPAGVCERLRSSSALSKFNPWVVGGRSSC